MSAAIRLAALATLLALGLDAVLGEASVLEQACDAVVLLSRVGSSVMG